MCRRRVTRSRAWGKPHSPNGDASSTYRAKVGFRRETAEDGDIRPSLIATNVPGSIAIIIAEQPIQRSGSNCAGCIPLRIAHAQFGMLGPYVREPPARELIERFIGEERSILR